MCVALICIKDRPTKETFRICFANNKDGAGVAWAYDNKLHLEKGFFTFDDFWKAYKQIPNDAPLLCHFRKSTHGPRDIKNCHPWRIDENHALIHNGILKFVIEMLKPIFKHNPRMWQEPWMKTLLENYIGIGNKCAILSNMGEYLILREEHGIWDNGVWYSNDSFRRRGIAAWSDYYVKKNSSPPTLELENASLEEVDVALSKADKLKRNNLSPTNKEINMKTKKGFCISNLNITSCTKKIIANKTPPSLTSPNRCSRCQYAVEPCNACQWIATHNEYD